MNASEDTALSQQPDSELRSARRVTLVGLVLDALLGIFKVLVGFL